MLAWGADADLAADSQLKLEEKSRRKAAARAARELAAQREREAAQARDEARERAERERALEQAREEKRQLARARSAQLLLDESSEQATRSNLHAEPAPTVLAAPSADESQGSDCTLPFVHPERPQSAEGAEGMEDKALQRQKAETQDEVAHSTDAEAARGLDGAVAQSLVAAAVWGVVAARDAPQAQDAPEQTLEAPPSNVQPVGGTRDGSDETDRDSGAAVPGVAKPPAAAVEDEAECADADAAPIAQPPVEPSVHLIVDALTVETAPDGSGTGSPGYPGAPPVPARSGDGVPEETPAQPTAPEAELQTDIPEGQASTGGAAQPAIPQAHRVSASAVGVTSRSETALAHGTSGEAAHPLPPASLLFHAAGATRTTVPATHPQPHQPHLRSPRQLPRASPQPAPLPPQVVEFHRLPHPTCRSPNSAAPGLPHGGVARGAAAGGSAVDSAAAALPGTVKPPSPPAPARKRGLAAALGLVCDRATDPRHCAARADSERADGPGLPQGRARGAGVLTAAPHGALEHWMPRPPAATEHAEALPGAASGAISQHKCAFFGVASRTLAGAGAGRGAPVLISAPALTPLPLASVSHLANPWPRAASAPFAASVPPLACAPANPRLHQADLRLQSADPRLRAAAGLPPAPSPERLSAPAPAGRTVPPQTKPPAATVRLSAADAAFLSEIERESRHTSCPAGGALAGGGAEAQQPSQAPSQALTTAPPPRPLAVPPLAPSPPSAAHLATPCPVAVPQAGQEAPGLPARPPVWTAQDDAFLAELEASVGVPPPAGTAPASPPKGETGTGRAPPSVPPSALPPAARSLAPMVPLPPPRRADIAPHVPRGSAAGGSDAPLARSSTRDHPTAKEHRTGHVARPAPPPPRRPPPPPLPAAPAAARPMAHLLDAPPEDIAFLASIGALDSPSGLAVDAGTCAMGTSADLIPTPPPQCARGVLAGAAADRRPPEDPPPAKRTPKAAPARGMPLSGVNGCPEEGRNGNWRCEHCMNINFGHRGSCNRCKAAKASLVEARRITARR